MLAGSSRWSWWMLQFKHICIHELGACSQKAFFKITYEHRYHQILYSLFYVQRSCLLCFLLFLYSSIYSDFLLDHLHFPGKFSGMFGHVHEAHEILLQSLSVLFSRNCSKHSSDSLPFLIESVGKYYPEDALAVERATLLYFICWFAVKSNCYQATRYLETVIHLILYGLRQDTL